MLENMFFTEVVNGKRAIELTLQPTTASHWRLSGGDCSSSKVNLLKNFYIGFQDICQNSLSSQIADILNKVIIIIKILNWSGKYWNLPYVCIIIWRFCGSCPTRLNLYVNIHFYIILSARVFTNSRPEKESNSSLI